MSMGPYGSGHRYAADRGYLPIYEIGARADVNVAQLVLNVLFAALVGALASNLSRRAVLPVLWTTAAVALVLGAWLGVSAFQSQMKSKAEGEESTAYWAINHGDFALAKQHLLNASDYWWWKGWWDGARSARERALDEEGMNKQAAAFLAQKNEELRRIQAAPQTAVPAWASTHAQTVEPPISFEDLIPRANSLTQDEEKLVHDPIDYQRGQWTTDWGKAFVVAKLFERNPGDRKAELDAFADQVGAQKRYMLIEKQKRGGVWWVRVFLYKR